MSSRIFLQTLHNKLKGGNLRSIYLNGLPGRLVGRLDVKQLDHVSEGLAHSFLSALLSAPSFEFRVSFDEIDLNHVPQDVQKKLGVISKRLNAICIDNEDYFKEHGTKTLGFGYPLLIRRSTKDPEKVIKAPLFIWPMELAKSKNKVNEWILLRNKVMQENGRVVEAGVHPIGMNQVLSSFIKSEDDVALPGLPSEMLEDSLLDQDELIAACARILEALNSGSKEEHERALRINFSGLVTPMPEQSQVDSLANQKAYIHFSGVFGLFRSQNESIITDISKLLERFDDFQFDALEVGNLSNSPFSAVDTDPSQQAIIGALTTEANQVIQGPPGTGKSQSLTALITNALANNLKCLVVCEKKTALDIIKQNLERKSSKIAALVGVVDDVNDDREAIVDSVRERQDKLFSGVSSQQAAKKYENATKIMADAASTINGQHRSLAQGLYRGETWTNLVGRFLALRRSFGQVPLRTALDKKGFTFQKQENELFEIMTMLDRANSLFDHSKDYHGVFDSLDPALFGGMGVSEAKLQFMDFSKSLQEQLPGIEAEATRGMAAAQDWIQNGFSELAPVVQTEVKPYLPCMEGQIHQKSPLPATFALEDFIAESISKLKAHQTSTQQFVQSYSAQLAAHYKAYDQDLTGAIDHYLAFIEENENEYGQAFFKNGPGAKFKTQVLSLVSQKYRRLKANRIEVKTGLEQIRIVQQTKKYLEHTYNDQEELSDLQPYCDNIRELREKLNSWRAKYPTAIDAYLQDINDKHTHPDLPEVKTRLKILLNDFADAVKLVSKRCGLAGLDNAASVQAVYEAVKAGCEQLSIHGRALDSFRQQFETRLANHRKIGADLSALIVKNGGGTIAPLLFTPPNHLTDIVKGGENARARLQAMDAQLEGFRAYHEWRTFLQVLAASRQQLVTVISMHQPDRWSEAFECWYIFTLLVLFEPVNLPKNDVELKQFRKQKEDFNEAQMGSIVANWTDRQRNAVFELRDKGISINSLFNKRGSKGNRRHSLRTIVGQEFELFTAFFPVLLVNPSVCSSIFPLEEGLFDVVIFDEASQLRLEETFAALLRGKAKIVSGDKHQMAPSAYFKSEGAVLDPVEQEEGDDPEEPEADERLLLIAHRNLADSESLLAYAEDKGFKQQYLDVHYRSQHPYLIDFSNHAFYGRRLIPIPAQSDYKPIEYIQVNGIFESKNHINRAEVMEVIRLLEHVIASFADGSYPSVGVATFNLYQRNLILDEIAKRRQESPEFEAKMGQLGSSFFVKNLENIQGDERDIIILSTTFGERENGTFTQQFGPIIQGKGHRMLNVIVTRAKHKIYVCTSIPQSHIGQYTELLRRLRNRGRAALFAYLMYAKAVSDGNDELRKGILAELSQHCSEKHYEVTDLGAGSESPFEEEVYSVLKQHIGERRVVQQYKLGGFRIDMVICSKITDKPCIAIECDGAKYHSSPEAYAWDLFRQDQLEKYGLVFHRIWSTKWWDASDKETNELLNFISAHNAREEAARVRYL
jgi:hypothetical protein